MYLARAVEIALCPVFVWLGVRLKISKIKIYMNNIFLGSEIINNSVCLYGTMSLCLYFFLSVCLSSFLCDYTFLSVCTQCLSESQNRFIDFLILYRLILLINISETKHSQESIINLTHVMHVICEMIRDLT